MDAYFSLENWMYESKDKPIEIKSAIIWGGLYILGKIGCINWEDTLRMYGDFISKNMNVR